MIPDEYNSSNYYKLTNANIENTCINKIENV